MINEIMKRLSELPNVTLSDGQEYIQLYDAMETVKRALEQEPCEDAISREAALEKMADYVASGYADSAEDFEEYSRIICQLPPVKPQDCDSCEVGNPCLYCKHEFEPQERSEKE